VGLRSYDPGQITDQFAPLYRTGGTGGGVWDGTGFGTGSGAGSVVVDDDGSRRGSAPPVVPSAPLGLVVSSSAKAVAADTPAVAATAANAKSASRRVRPLASDEAATSRVLSFSEGTPARAMTPNLRCRWFSTRDDRAKECVLAPARRARITPVAAVTALAAAHDVGIVFAATRCSQKPPLYSDVRRRARLCVTDRAGGVDIDT
jgi:hypothetical protein